MWRLLVAGVGAALLASCGAAPGGPGAVVSPPATESPTGAPVVPGPDIMIGDQSHDVAATTGQRLYVFLTARPRMTNWSNITSSNVRVLSPAVIDVMVPHGVTAAAFEAVGPGVALIAAFARPLCPAPCASPNYAALFSVKVTVTTHVP